MTRLLWAGGEHDFALRIGELRALQDRCGAGPGHVLQRLATGQWRVDDPIEVIRLALMGGGMKREDAARLVTLHVEAKPLTGSVVLAYGILSAALNGVEDDPVGERRAGEVETPNPPTADGVSAGSTAPEQ
jgi:hypothetical protein